MLATRRAFPLDSHLQSHKYGFDLLRVIRMYVCICNSLTDRDVRRAAQESGERRCPKTVYRRLGCRPRCGRCLSFAGEIIAEGEETTAPAVPLPAAS